MQPPSVQELVAMPFTRCDTDVNPKAIIVSPGEPTYTPGNGLYGRQAECKELDRLIADVRAAQGRALILRGEAGAGKSALLDYLANRASGSGYRVARVVGVESEMELAFAGLHQLCAPTLSRVERLPEPQREALRTAFGLAAGAPPDRFCAGLAVLSLLAGAAGERPLICLVDDAQWLDRASVQVLGFVARRMAADPVGFVFAARDPSLELAGLPELHVRGLQDHDARALLASVLAAPLDARVADQIVAETRGNPLALLELTRGMCPAELAGGFGFPGAQSAASPLTSQIEEGFARRLAALPEQTRRLVQLAAADPSGDRSLVRRAAGWLGIPAQAAASAVEAEMVEFGTRVRFRHPLARSAAYRATGWPERQQVHAALAEVTDPVVDPDRRAWHRAQATAGPDEEVAAELERLADRAQARGGLAATAAFLERSVALTADPARHTERVLGAAQASMQAGAFGQALELLATAETWPLDEFARARVDLLRVQVAFASGLGTDAPSLLLKAARRLEPFDEDLARETYLVAWGAAEMAGSVGDSGVLVEICRAIRALPVRPGDPRPLDLLLDGLATLIIYGPAAAATTLQRAAEVLISIPVEDILRWGWMAPTAYKMTWDIEGLHAISVRQVQLVRDAGGLAQLPFYLAQLGLALPWMGDFAGANAVIAESDNVAAATGSPIIPYSLVRLLALQGREAEAAAQIESTMEAAAASGPGMAAAWAQWAAAVLYNGLARYQKAAAAARYVTSDTNPSMCMWGLPELVEAAARSGDAELARDALERLAETTKPAGSDTALGLEARCRALLSDGTTADELYREAIDRLGRTRLRPELARAHLLYGEWLRREGRRVEARTQLRAAHDMLAAIGMAAFAARARHELIATGETVRKRNVETLTTLTAQEALIARMARDGCTNPEIGAQLFLSGRTVEWHLRKIFTKLGISSRRELNAALTQAA
jgi:DNA-binding CsgD family transcriptional regulator/tetratricopeptide (TPR) repeat protein